MRRRQSWWAAPLGLPMYYKEERAIADKAHALAARLGLDDVCDEQAGGLPYGAQRRLEIAALWPRNRDCCCWTSLPRA